jgi:Protein of unknown function (DUF4019)
VVKKFTAVIIASALSCSALALTLTPEDEAARQAAFDWLQVVDSGNYKHAVLLMSEEVRGQQDWLGYLNTQRARLGGVDRRQLGDVKHASTIPGLAGVRKYLLIQFKTSFERKPVSTEEVVMAKMGCCWEVSGYSIATVTSDR